MEASSEIFQHLVYFTFHYFIRIIEFSMKIVILIYKSKSVNEVTSLKAKDKCSID